MMNGIFVNAEQYYYEEEIVVLKIILMLEQRLPKLQVIRIHQDLNYGL